MSKSKEKFKDMHRRREYTKAIKTRRHVLRGISTDDTTKYDLIDDLIWNKDVDEDMQYVIENYSFWAKAEAIALEAFQNYETKIDVWKAKKEEYFRIKLGRKGGKPSISQIDAAIKRHPNYYKLHKKLE